MQHTQQLFLEALKAALKNEQVEWNNKSLIRVMSVSYLSQIAIFIYSPLPEQIKRIFI